jgi:hypothetical protein
MCEMRAHTPEAVVRPSVYHRSLTLVTSMLWTYQSTDT